jgi:hypothetical protein
MKKSWLIILVIIIAVGVGWYFRGWYDHQTGGPLKIPVRDIVAPSSNGLLGHGDVIAFDNDIQSINWAIYENRQYGFSIQYPEDWRVDENLGDNSLVAIGQPGVLEGGVLKIYNFKTQAETMDKLESERKEFYADDQYPPKFTRATIGGYQVLIVNGLPGIIDGTSIMYVALGDGFLELVGDDNEIFDVIHFSLKKL